jgi:putative ABC transport system permease protein
VVGETSRHLLFAIRNLTRARKSTVIIVLTLALGIGASSAVFTVVNAVLLEPLPFPNADRLVRVRQTRERATVANVAPVRLEEWNASSSTFEAMMGYTVTDYSDTYGDLPERIRVAGVSPRMMEVWGIVPIAGRGFVTSDHEEGAAPVALISERYWRRRFDADAGVIGTTIRSGDSSAELIGVMPADFAFPDPGVEIWFGNTFSDFLLYRGNAWYTSFGRLKPGVAVEQAQAELRAVQAQLAEQYPDTDREIGVEIESLADATVGAVRPSLWLTFGAVSVLLLIACLNIAALLFARATDRQRDIEIRLALGAPRASIAAQMLVETFALAVPGAGLGLLVANGATIGFRALAPEFPRIDEIALSSSTLLFVGAVVVAVTFLCGLAPAIRSATGVHECSVSASGRSQVSGRHASLWVFVGVQVALSVALLAGAGVLIRSLQALWQVDTGFNSENVLTFRITGSYAEDFDSMVQGVEQMLAELESTPGIEVAATSSPVPGVLSDQSGFQFGAATWTLVEGGVDPEVAIAAEQRVVSSSYFDTMQIPMLAGEQCRRRTGDDMRDIVINEAFASRYLSGLAPVGLHLRSPGGNVVRIVSVVGNAREFGAAREPVPTTYRCFTANAYPPLAFLVRTTGDPMTMVNTVRRTISAVAPSRSVYDVVTLEQRVGNEYSADSLRTALISVFAGAALALVSLGIYGTLSYLVSLRRREVGLRVALGALQQTIVSHYLFKALRVVGIACLAGLVVAYALTRSISSWLFAVSSSDPITLASVIVIVLLVATIAALVPAVRAARIDPMEALRDE